MARVRFVEFPAFGQVVVREEGLSDAPLAPFEAVVRSEASIVSAGTELARLHGLESYAPFPDRPGYGMIGRVEAKGEALTGFEVGERVFFAGSHSSVQRFTHGRLNEWGHLFRVPGDLDPRHAALTCMARIAYTGPEVTRTRVGERVAVFGLGLVGVLAALQYQLEGAEVLGLDPSPERCRWAEACGVRQTTHTAPGTQVDAVKDWTGGQGAHVCCEASGLTPVAETAVFACADLGRVCLLGSPRKPSPGDLQPMLWDIHLRGLSLLGAHMFRYPVARTRDQGLTVEDIHHRMLALIASGALPAEKLITHTIGVDQAPGIYEALQSRPAEYGAVIIDWR